MKTLVMFKLIGEYLGASREVGAEPPPLAALEPLPPRVRAWLASPWLRGLWWGLLAGAILFFSGQTSKFIYIDF